MPNSAARIRDASVAVESTALVYPTRSDVVTCARMLRDELRADFDTDPTDVRELPAAPSSSGEHRLDLPAILPCPDHDPADPRCQQCLAATREGR